MLDMGLAAAYVALLAPTALASTVISGDLSTSSLTQQQRVTRNGDVSQCNATKSFPGVISMPATNRKYQVLAVRNDSGQDTCVSATLVTPGTFNVEVVVYSAPYDPTNVAAKLPR